MTASERSRPRPTLRRAAVRRSLVLGIAMTVVTVLVVDTAGAAMLEDPTTTAPATTAPTTTAPPPPAPAPPPPPPAIPVGPSGLAVLGPVLASGSTGLEVVVLQFALARRGFFLREQLGRFGESTRHALVAFQKYYGLARTGKLDFWSRIALSGEPTRAAALSWAGGHRIDVSLGRQVMVIATDGYVDGVFDISSGKSSTPTPRGSFRLQREIRGRRVSSLGTLISPKYFTGGYAIHGSPSVPAYPASHGCVRLTNQTIDYLWNSGLIPLGTPIRIS